MKLIALLTIIAISQAVFVKHASDPHMGVYAQLEKLEDSPLGKKILDTVALQMKNKSPLGDIAKMLQDLRESLVFQQQDAELVHVAQEADCEAEIHGYNRRINFATQEITEASMDMNKHSSDIDLLQTDIQNKEIELQILNQQEEQLREQRQDDHDAYVQREIQTPKVIEAIDVIAAKLSAIEPESDAVAVLAELESVGSANPILALVQLASTFSADKLMNVQMKIGELRDSLEQGLINDREEEIQAQLNFDAQIYSYGEQREAIQLEKADSEAKLTQAEHLLAAAKKRKLEASKELDSAVNGKKLKEEICDNQRSMYARDTEQRTTEIGIVRQVEGILATKLEGASNYMKGRIN